MPTKTGALFEHSVFTLFAAGAIAVLVFHQGAHTLLCLMGLAGAPFPTEPTWPFGVPQIWSLTFWGGVWGIAFGLAERWFPKGALYWVAALLFGAVLVTLVSWLVVAPLKGIAIGWEPARIMASMFRNGAWGLGTALLLWWRA